MLRNYLKIAIRNLQRNKAYAALNVLGLSVGIAACLLLFVIIRFEKSFDSFHHNSEHIYRLGSEFHNEDDVSYSEGVSFPTASAIRLDFPQIKKVASIYQWGNGIVSVEDGTGQAPKKYLKQRFIILSLSFSNSSILAGYQENHVKHLLRPIR